MKYRDDQNERTLVLVHGFSGETAWKKLVTQLMEHHALKSWDIHSFEYATRESGGLRYKLGGTPSLEKVARTFVTHCRSTLNRYRNFSILAHSAGGLVVQRALLDSKWLQSRASHVALFGTPTGGVRAARLVDWLIPQLRDVATGSAFLKSLQERLASEWQEPPFALRVVAAVDDSTVPEDSVFYRFPTSIRRTVPGNHISMIQPEGPDAAVVGLVVNLISSTRLFLSYVREDENRVRKIFRTLERREFAPWIDQQRLTPGDVWQSSIMAALRDSNRFLVFLSAAAIAELSNDGVFKQEVDTAIMIQEERGKASPFIVPVRLDDEELPSVLTRYQWYDLFSGSADDLADLLERSTLNPR